MSKRITKYSIIYWKKLGFSEEEAVKKVLEFKQATRKNKNICIEYWLNKGFSEEFSKIKIKEIQSENSKKRKDHYTPNQLQFWCKLGFTIEESKEKIQLNLKKSSPLYVDNWIRRGLTEIEAKEKISKIQSKNAYKVKNHTNNININYLINSGLTEIEAKEKIKKRQTTFSLEKCVKKYGELEGKKKWEERQIKWQNTLNLKYSKEKRKEWSSFTYEDFTKKYGKEKADKWLKNKVSHNFYSKISSELFNEIQKNINKYFYFGENEYVISGNNWIYKLDFYDKESKKAIEFNGDFWHANPQIYKDIDINPYLKLTAKEIWEFDNNRIKNIKTKINDIIIIWESEYIKDKKKIIDKCINFLQNE